MRKRNDDPKETFFHLVFTFNNLVFWPYGKEVLMFYTVNIAALLTLCVRNAGFEPGSYIPPPPHGHNAHSHNTIVVEVVGGWGVSNRVSVVCSSSIVL